MRPSDVAKAKRVLEAGHDRHDEFCDAFYSFEVGKYCRDRGDDLVRRHSHDLLADGAFEAASSLLEGSGIDSIADNETVSVAIDWLKLVPDCGSKVLSSWGDWSLMRKEERREDLVCILEKMVHVVEHSVALATGLVITAIRPFTEDVTEQLAGRDPGAMPTPSAFCYMSALSSSAWEMLQELGPLREQTLSCINYLESLLDSITKSSMNDVNIGDATSELLETLGAPFSWLEMLWVYLGGLEVMYVIVMRSPIAKLQPPLTYPDMLTEFLDQSGKPYPEDLDMRPPRRAEALSKVPFLRLLTKCYFCQDRVSKEPVMPGEFWRPIAKILPEDAVVEETIDWLETGPLASLVNDEVWVPLRDSIFTSLGQEFQITSATTIEASVASGPIDAKSLPLLISADLAKMASHTRSYIDFADISGSTGIKLLPHAKHCVAFCSVLAQTSKGSLLAPVFQHTLAEAKAA